MIDAGLPLVQALDIIGTQADNPAFRKVLLAVKSKVEAGSTFADALAEHPKVFDELFVQLVRAGEIGGILDTILQRLGAYIEKNEKLKRRVKGAMVYPAIVLIVAIGVVGVLLGFVVPTFEKMFKDMGGALPGPTQFLVDISHGFRSTWYLFVGHPGCRRSSPSRSPSRKGKGQEIWHAHRPQGSAVRAAGPQGGRGAVHPDAGHHDLLRRAHPRRAGDRGQVGRQPDDRERHPLRPGEDLRRARTSPARWPRPRCSRPWWCR